MSSGEEWANDANSPRRGCPLRLAVLAAALVALIVLAASWPSTQAPNAPTPPPAAPVTGAQPQPPATAMLPASAQVRP